MGGGPQISIFTSSAGAGSRSCVLRQLDDSRSVDSDVFLRWVVQNMIDSNAFVFARKIVQILLEQNVIIVDIRKDQVDLRLIPTLPTTYDGPHNLQHRRNSRTPSNHSKPPNHVRRIHHRALRALHLHSIAYFQCRKVPADVASRVALNEQIEETRVYVGRDGCVRTHDLAGLDFLSFRVFDVEHRAEGNVLPDWEAKDAVGRGKGETVDGGIVGKYCLFCEREILELVGDENLLSFWRGG
jgi:hypothetical protein